MAACKKLSLVLLFITIRLSGYAQQSVIVDSLKKELSKATTADAKVQRLDQLSRVLMSGNIEESEKYGQQLILVAEESRDRKLMIKAYLSNGLRCSYFAGRKEFIDKAIGFYEKALTIAKENKLQEEIGIAQLRLAAVYLANSNKEKASAYANQGFSVIMNLYNDSLKCEAYITNGDVNVDRNEKILALRNYLNALRIAEDINNKPLIRDCYLNLATFYSSIEDYDKAIDYFTLAYNKLDIIKTGNAQYQKPVYLNSIGNLYAAKKSYDIAIGYFEHSIALADSLKFPSLKIPGYLSLLNQYLLKDEPQKALVYFNSPQGQTLRQYLAGVGMVSIIDEAYAVIYTGTGQFDSARVCFARATPFFEKGTTQTNKINFYAQLGSLYEKTGEVNKAIGNYLKVKDMALQNGLLPDIQSAAKHLDSLYIKTGNYKLSNQYNSMYYLYKDSTEKLNKEKELAQVEAADEQQRLDKEEKKKEEEEIRSHNIQYMGITIGIATFFLILVVMGIFKVSENSIKVLGFFAFIMFFEFIILIADNKIHHYTNGEPWKVLAIKIILIAMLLPLHHWLEEKVIHYLTSHNRLTAAGLHIRKVLSRKKTTGQ